jgi:SAM-dependent methyltransferase
MDISRLFRKKPRVTPVGRRDATSPNHADPEIIRISNLIDYTKIKGASYSAQRYTAGYHSMQLGGHEFTGQRNPRQRLEKVPLNFNGLTVLDVGCNQGGMLHELADKISQGVGIDYDARMINAANKIKSVAGSSHLHYFVFDLDNEPLDYINDFLPEDRVDVVLLLSVCKWISAWRETIRYLESISDSLLFESNGKPELQRQQVEFLNSLYPRVELLSEISDDDPLTKGRKLYLCR